MTLRCKIGVSKNWGLHSGDSSKKDFDVVGTRLN